MCSCTLMFAFAFTLNPKRGRTTHAWDVKHRWDGIRRTFHHPFHAHLITPMADAQAAQAASMADAAASVTAGVGGRLSGFAPACQTHY